MDLSEASEKISSDTAGIDPGTFRLVAQRLNHYAAPGPWLTDLELWKYRTQHTE